MKAELADASFAAEKQNVVILSSTAFKGSPSSKFL